MVMNASVWVSSLVGQDLHHDASRRWLGEQIAAGEALVIPSIALPEVAGAVSRRTGSADLGHEAVGEMARTPGLRIVSLDPDLAAESARAAADLGLRGADAVYVTTAR